MSKKSRNPRKIRKRIVQQHTSDYDGHSYVQLDTGNELEWRRVGEMVLEAFRGPRPSPESVVEHIDGNKNNNALTNLRWSVPV